MPSLLQRGDEFAACQCSLLLSAKKLDKKKVRMVG
jgi:hypothetical protein